MKNIIEIHFNILNIEDDGYHIQIEAEVNHLPCTLLVDTGASKTVFDLMFFTEHFEDFIPLQEDRISVGLGTNSMISHSTVIKTLNIGALNTTNFKTTLLDLSHVNVSYEKLFLPRIAGVLGGDLLMKHQAVIDYCKQIITLTF